MKHPENNPWIIHTKRLEYDNPWISVTEYQVRNPGGGSGIYGTVHFKNLAIGIVALTDDDQLFLVGQYRFPLGKYSWEIPEGGGAPDILPQRSAQRELQEETGLIAASWELLLEMHLSNSVTDERGIVFLATGLRQEEPMPEETERLQIWKLPFAEAYDLMCRGVITDALTIAALLKLKIRRLEQRPTTTMGQQ